MWKQSVKLLTLFRNKINVDQTLRVRMLNNHSNYKYVAFKPLVSRTCGSNISPSCTTKSLSPFNYIKPPKQTDDLQNNTNLNDDDKSWNGMKYAFIASGLSLTFMGGYILYELGKPPMDKDGNLIQDQFSHMSTYKQFLYRVFNEINYYKRMIQEPSREKLLPDPLSYPYYQPPYTLVLEMKDVLVHPEWTYEMGWRFKKRPGLDHFLQSLSGVFEIVIFTADQDRTIYPLIEALDPNHLLISFVLLRDCTHYVDGLHIKDLSKLNRSLDKVIMVDWNKNSVKFQPENLFHMEQWNGNDDDSALIDLASFLRTVAELEAEDVRDVLKHYKQFDNPLQVFREKQKELIEQQQKLTDIQKQQQQQQQYDTKPSSNWFPKLFSNQPNKMDNNS